MPVKFEVKGMLAKCLAMEDIIVEHKKVQTASFNVHTRCLTLPLWEKASDNIYTMLVLHEISHSLWTPDIEWTKTHNVPGQFVNVCEDVRVEKLCKRKYPGSPKSFYAGYKELAEQDFFQIGNDDLNTYNLADRANLYFKIGSHLNLQFTEEEREIIDQIAATETFVDALDAAEALYLYCKKEKEQESKIDWDSHENQTSGSGGSGGSDFANQEEGENEQEDGEDTESSSDNSGQSDVQKNAPDLQDSRSNGGPSEPEEPDVKTVKSLEDALQELVNSSGYENTYIEIPKVDPNKVINSNAEIHKACDDSWASYLEGCGYTKDEIFGEVDRDYREFKRSAQKEVNYLVKEFECRKAADSYARASTARTGILDCSKLHTYKYNEDLFKKVTTLANGKNHGLIFILDWSGSMQEVMLDTIKQLFNLIWFCKKVSIPFEVYAFTTDYPRVRYDENGKAIMPEDSYVKKDGVLEIGSWFSMMNMLTSKVNSSTLERQMMNIYRIAKCFGYNAQWRVRYSVPVGWSLSGTPLNEALITLHEIIPQFQKENKLQKVQCVVLTDGEASQLKVHKEVQRRWEKEPYIGTVHYNPSTSFLRDRKTGNTYSLDTEYRGFTDVLLRNLRDKFPTVNFIGMRVLESRDSGSFIRHYCGYYGVEYDRVMTSWRKEKTFSIKNSGYHTYFGISASALSNDTEFKVVESASKTQIKSAFVKSLKGKKMNKKVLLEFAELIS